MVVGVDKTLFARRKDNTGRVSPTVNFWRIIPRRQAMFLVKVLDHKAEALLAANARQF